MVQKNFLFNNFKTKPDQPIGIFDSGPGGLAVLKYILAYLSAENIIYLGDTARQPYGIQDPAQVKQYTIEACTYLKKNHAKCILIGCNTASVAGLTTAQKLLPDIPILGMIDSGVMALSKIGQSQKIGVWGTRLTVNSHAYQNAIRNYDETLIVHEEACPELLRLAEKGAIQNKDQIKGLCERYYEPLRSKGVSKLILGCTDLTCVRDEIEDVVGQEVEIIDPAEEIVQHAACLLKESDLINTQKISDRHYDFRITGEDTEGFKKFVFEFIGLESIQVRNVSLKAR
jgi:glutamate racemase